MVNEYIERVVYSVVGKPISTLVVDIGSDGRLYPVTMPGDSFESITDLNKFMIGELAYCYSVKELYRN